VDKRSRMSVTRVAYCALFTTLALILSYVESKIPAPVPVPGVKLGLANLAIIMVLYIYSWKEALLVSILRIFLSSLLFGSAISLSFSLAGGFVSLLVMIILKKTNLFPLMGVSMIGGVAHNFGQMVVAICMVQTLSLGYYFAILMITGALTGLVIGYVGGLAIKTLKKVMIRR